MCRIMEFYLNLLIFTPEQLYSIYTIHLRLYEIDAFKGDLGQLMQLIIDSKEYELRKGFVKRMQ